MKMHRLCLFITNSERNRINRQATALGIDPGDFVRRAARLVDADDLPASESLAALLPEFNAAVDRIHATLTAAAERALEHEQDTARLRSNEYRQAVLAELAADPDILRAGAELFGGPHRAGIAEALGTSSPDRMREVAQARRAAVRDEPEGWAGPEAPDHPEAK
jgi:hypothetical protein